MSPVWMSHVSAVHFAGCQYFWFQTRWYRSTPKLRTCVTTTSRPICWPQRPCLPRISTPLTWIIHWLELCANLNEQKETHTHRHTQSRLTHTPQYCHGTNFFCTENCTVTILWNIIFQNRENNIVECVSDAVWRLYFASFDEHGDSTCLASKENRKMNKTRDKRKRGLIHVGHTKLRPDLPPFWLEICITGNGRFLEAAFRKS